MEGGWGGGGKNEVKLRKMGRKRNREKGRELKNGNGRCRGGMWRGRRGLMNGKKRGIGGRKMMVVGWMVMI